MGGMKGQQKFCFCCSCCLCIITTIIINLHTYYFLLIGGYIAVLYYIKKLTLMYCHSGEELPWPSRNQCNYCFSVYIHLGKKVFVQKVTSTDAKRAPLIELARNLPRHQETDSIFHDDCLTTLSAAAGGLLQSRLYRKPFIAAVDMKY